MQRAVAGSFGLRFSVIALLLAPFMYWIFRCERRKELHKLSQVTICPQCDKAGDGNAGGTCQCGGKFVPASTLKWVE